MGRSSEDNPSMSMAGLVLAFIGRFQGWIRFISVIAIIIGLFLIARTVPIEVGVARLQEWIDGMGLWGPVVFSAVYVASALLFVPGLLLTLAAGAIFGLFAGFIIASTSATVAAGVAFLIGRYLARDAVRRQAAKYPRFRAIDKAIGRDGWKVVALLRLAPVFPYSVGNYLLGLTSIRFWPYVITSWIAMLPAAFVWVYLGHLGRMGIEHAGDGRERTTLEWVLLIIGLLAVVGLMVYIVRLAMRTLARETAAPDTEGRMSEGDDDSTEARPWMTIFIMFAAALVLLLALGARLNTTWWHTFIEPQEAVRSDDEVS